MSLFGIHLDDLFSYDTQKIVRLRDRRLGITYWCFAVLIASYVVGFQILYSNEHFQRRDVFGTARITIQQPTKGCNPNDKGCKSNFHALTELPYCKVYKGNSTQVAAKHQHDCIFADQHTLSPTGMLSSEMLVPTRIDSMSESKGCNPGPENGYRCDNEYELDNNKNIIYVADIEKFTLLLAHSFKRDHLSGNNQWKPGYLLECEEEKGATLLPGVDQNKLNTALNGQQECNGKIVKKPIECINDKCPFLGDKKKAEKSFLQDHSNTDAGHRRASSHKGHMQASLLTDDELQAAFGVNPGKLVAGGFFAIPNGDVFRLDKLLQLSGLSLDDTFNIDGEPLRAAGTVIEIECIYSNMHAFWSSLGYTDISYSYKVSARPMEEMKTELFAQFQPDFPRKRIIEDRHGLYIVAKISGEFGFFSIVYTLVMLTTAVALISVAVVITDKLAIYIMPERETYRGEKYFLTERLGDVQKSKEDIASAEQDIPASSDRTVHSA